jgi:hypothetical protein
MRSHGWKQTIASILAFVLLAPVPVFATIDFSTFQWSGLSDTNNFFQSGSNGFSFTSFDSTPGDPTTSHTVLTFTPRTVFFGQNFTASVTTTVPSASSQLILGASDKINGNWNNLTAIQISSGDLIISVGSSPPGGSPPNNMFSADYTSTPSGSVAIPGLAGPATINTITVTIQGTNFFSSNSSSSFTLDLHN